MTATLPPVSSLVARTVRLEEPPDLLATAGDTGFLWREETCGLAAHGVAARLDLPGGLADRAAVEAVAAALAAVRVEDSVGLPGCGAVAIGALDFDPASPGHLVVPRRIVGRRDDIGWVTTIEAAAGDPPWPDEDPASPGVGASPDRFVLESSMPHEDWKDVVARAVEVMNTGALRKVVLARRIDITGNRPFVLSEVLGRLAALYPSCMVFSVEGFIGASPELLLRRSGDVVESHPLAGTVARSGDAHSDELLVAGLMGSPKTRHEHQVVVDAVKSTLAEVCAELNVPDQPSVLGLRNVSHLATHITGRLAGTPDNAGDGVAGWPSALDLVARLHPTPAVGGTPTDAAVRYLQDVEKFDRGRYAGPVGWVDSRGDGAWAIGIRCAEVEGDRARIYAGNGMVVGSDPDDELAETQLKLQALLAALVRP